MEMCKIAQMGMAFSQSYLSYLTNSEARPFSASFAVSNKCNIHCSYCNFPSLHSPDLDLKQIDLLFSRLKQLGVKRLGLLGGEPLFRKDIIDIISLAKKHNFFVSLNTNLLLYEKFKNNLNNVDYFFTSIDGTPETHIKNRGKQSFEKIISAVRQIRCSGKKLTAICVVNQQSMNDINYLLELAEKEKINIHFQPECYDTEYVTNKGPQHETDNENLRQIWQYLIHKKKAGAPIASSLNYLEYISKWDNYSVSALYDPDEKCAAGRGYLFVDVEGNAFPCAYTKEKTKGINLLKEDWSKAFDKKTPCTKCIVGPMLEFNLLFKKPFSSVANAVKNVG
jgi:MoaA/NifB/PqqE/SkfB family radical SAM enzyme